MNQNGFANEKNIQKMWWNKFKSNGDENLFVNEINIYLNYSNTLAKFANDVLTSILINQS